MKEVYPMSIIYKIVRFITAVAVVAGAGILMCLICLPH